MTNPAERDPIDRLVAAYEKMLERVHDGWSRSGQDSAYGLRNALRHAREKAVELEELTREEAEKISTYLERDVRDAARYLSDTGETLKGWWRLDLKLIEERLTDLFAAVADRTSLELKALADQAERLETYHTGEVASPGRLKCSNCGKDMHFHKTGRIPPCPACRGTEFRRPNSSPS